MAMDLPHYGPSRMRRDLGKSVLLGPLRLIIPSMGYLALYPLLLRRYGAEVLGLWALLAVMTSAFGAADIGFSQLLRREVDPNDDVPALRERRADYSTAQIVYGLVFVGGGLVVLLGASMISGAVRGVYDPSPFIGSIVVLLAASTLQLALQLDDAVLAALQDASYAHAVRAATPILMLIGAFAGAFTGFPIEGLSLGTLVANASTLALLRRRLHTHHDVWAAAGTQLFGGSSIRRIGRVAKRGMHFYSIALGTIARDPLARVVIASVLGLAAVAVWDVAMRVTRLVRDLVTSGVVVLYPSLAFLSRARDHAEMVRLMQLALILVTVLGGAGLGLVAGLADMLLPVVFPELQGDLAGTTRVLAVWSYITLLNVPFWYALQATGFERHAAWSLWAHTASLALLIPLGPRFSFGIIGLAGYWTASAVVTQVLIFYQAHRRLDLFWPVLRNAPTMTAVTGSMALVTAAIFSPTVGGALEGRGVPTSAASLAYLLCIYILFALLIGRQSWRPIAGFITDIRLKW